jgi:Copper type II ascorbate-dependent monooxygenase, C-terminal domain
MRHLLTSLSLAVMTFAVTAGASCFYSTESPLPDSFATCAEAAAPEPTAATEPAASATRELTYYRDLKPLLDEKCAGCHRPGDVAPFPLQTYAEVTRYLPQVRAAVTSRRMPPWQPDPCCTHYRGERSLSEQQLAELTEWIDAGAAAGAPSEAPPVVSADDLPRVDVRAAMPEAFVPSPRVGVDEVRCFVLDTRFDADTFVVGMNVIPGDRREVHHVIVYAVPEATAEALAKKQRADGRAGWDCYGDITEIRADGAIGGWQPGYRPMVLPQGYGRAVHAGSRLVLNVHYDTGHGVGADVTSVELMLADSVEHVERGVAIINPLWLAGQGMEIAAGDPDASVFFSYDPTVLFNKKRPLYVHGVMLHMHELGSVGRLAILRKNGAVECLLNITRWDFHWLSDYYLTEPVRIDPGDKLYLECHWDNRAGHQKTVRGELQPPRTIGWGLDEEMCAATVTVSD